MVSKDIGVQEQQVYEDLAEFFEGMDEIRTLLESMNEEIIRHVWL